MDIYFIMVSPRDSDNIASTARVLLNFGFHYLRFVQPHAPLLRQDARFKAIARKEGMKVIDQSLSFPDLTSAIQDLDFVVTTSRRKGKLRGPFYPPEEIFPEACRRCVKKMGIVFGTERNGLATEDLRAGDWVSCLPVSDEFPSLNLSHAIGIFAGFLRMGFQKGDHSIQEKKKSAEHEDIERFFSLMVSALEGISFFKSKKKSKILQMRRMIGRLGPSRKELDFLSGIPRAMDRASKKKKN